ncbi:MAG: SseB family protein, partial [Abditibacteriota bacterium]|nr:SseB family protein [Abditibacteriota bacterium]
MDYVDDKMNAQGRQIEKDNEALRSAVEDFNKNGSYEKYKAIAEMLWNSTVCVPLKMALSEEAEAVLAAVNEREDKTFTAEEDAVLKKGMEPCPMTVKGKDGRKYFFVFTSEKEIGDNFKYDIAHPDPFSRVVAMILNLEHKPDTVVLNPFTQSFEIETKVLKAMLALKSGDRELLKEVAEKVEAE